MPSRNVASALTLLALLFVATTPSSIYVLGDSIGDKFQKCCKDSGMSCPEVCTYPPPDFTFSEQWCMLSWAAQFIKCYTGGHNNVKCCADHGVVGIYGICQDFCDGTTSHGWDPRYLVCGPVKGIISKCNYDSNKPH